ncbi:MAG: zinc ribbon domain-containing protein [Candidatus Kapaibacterium sp.]
MAQFARCPECGALNDGASHDCYLCGASPLLVACSACGAEVRNPVHSSCPACGSEYAHRRRRPGINHGHEGDGADRAGPLPRSGTLLSRGKC